MQTKLFRRGLALTAACLLALGATGCEKEKDALHYRYDYDLAPYIELGTYKGLPAQAVRQPVTDADIAQEVLATRSYYAEVVPVERAAQDGDTVQFTSVVTLDGETVESLSKESDSVTLGFDAYGAEIEAALQGCRAGDTFTANRTMPAYMTEYADKTVVYTITVQEVCENRLREYDDVFVKAYLGFDSVAEYESSLREVKEYQAEMNYQNAILAQVWPVVLENAQVLAYPEEELNTYRDNYIDEIIGYCQKNGINVDSYLNSLFGVTEEEFRADAQTIAEEHIKEQMVIYAIARAENLTVTDGDYQAYAQAYANENSYDSVEALEQAFTHGAIREGALGEAVRRLVVQNAVVTEPEA